MVSSVASATTTTTDTTKSAAGAKSLAKNFDTFLTMLTVQLKHQDPLSPMDSTQFTNQLVQFAGVEQQINANSNLEKLITSNNMNTKSQAINYIGHTVEVDTAAAALQDGKANFSVTLGKAAKSANIVITDSAGAIVNTLTGKTTTDRQEIAWDGKDKNGVQLKDDYYTISVTAMDGEGNSVDSAITTYGKVTDVASDSTGTLLGIGKVVANIDKILTVRDSASLASSATSSSSTTTK